MSADAPTCVGVPESTPVEESVNPLGSVPLVTAKLYGAVPPLAVIVWLYDVPTVPSGSVGGLKVMAGQSIVSA